MKGLENTSYLNCGLCMMEHGFEERSRNNFLPAMEAEVDGVLLGQLPAAMKAGSLPISWSHLRFNRLPLGSQQPQPRVGLLTRE